VESNFTQEMVKSLGQKYPGKNRLVFHNQDSILSNLCTFCLFCYRSFLADFLQRPTLLIRTMSFPSATSSAWWTLLRAMKSMPLTPPLSRLLAMVGLRTIGTQDAGPRQPILLSPLLPSFSRNPMPLVLRLEGHGCAWQY
jgi:hypothetical protein